MMPVCSCINPSTMKLAQDEWHVPTTLSWSLHEGVNYEQGPVSRKILRHKFSNHPWQQ